MIRINLLPHRAEKRRRRQIQFISLCVVTAIVAALLVGAGYGVMSARIFYQDKRNDFLKQEIAKLEKQIEELERLRAETNRLLARKEEVEKLQTARSDVVHLLDQMLHILPPGIFLKTLKQTSTPTGSLIAITGIAQSDARVSTLMRAIEASRWLDTPTLIDVHSVTSGMGGKERVNEFSLTFNLKKGVEITPASAVAPATASGPVASSAVAAAAPASAVAPVTSAKKE